MAKYITKENLPVFKYVNPVSMDFYEEAQNDLNTMLVYYKNIQDSLRQDKPEIFSEEEKVHMINLILKCRKYYPQSFFADGPGQQGILSKIKERVDAIDLANTQFLIISQSIYLNKMTIFIMQNQMRKSLMVQK